MLTQIKQELKRLEETYNIRILYAVESGSRAWGFASQDSDWDVRFLYVHPLDWYLQIDDKKDSIEQILPNDIDLSGWELRKALKLFRKSNPSLMEWLNSPILYLENGTLADSLRTLAAEYFNSKSCLHHYLHMAEGNFSEYLQRDLVRVKKYFYVLRPILACEWIYRHNTMPPMEFKVLIDELVDDTLIKAEIEKLLVRKIAGEELNEEPRINILNTFLQEKIRFFQEYTFSLAAIAPPDSEKLNALFRELVISR